MAATVSKSTVSESTVSKSTVSIAGREIGPGQPCFVIAEMTANHDQDLDRALKLVDIAADAGCDALKLQTYTADTMTVTSGHPSTRVDPMWGHPDLYSLYRTASMPWEFHAPIFKRAAERGMIAFSSAFDATSVDLLESLQVPAYKIASFEMVDLPLLRKIAATGKPVILSTGMSTLAEVDEAVTTLRGCGCTELILLHCCSSYPAPPESVNLRAMDTMRTLYGTPVGFSDHTVGSAVAVAAAARGADVVEKHFTDDPSRPGPDHRFSVDQATLTRLVAEIRIAQSAIGSGVKQAQASEIESKRVGRRSLFSARALKAGEIIMAEDVRVVRPGVGLHPRYREIVIGRPARIDIPEGHPLTWDSV